MCYCVHSVNNSMRASEVVCTIFSWLMILSVHKANTVSQCGWSVLWFELVQQFAFFATCGLSAMYILFWWMIWSITAFKKYIWYCIKKLRENHAKYWYRNFDFYYCTCWPTDTTTVRLSKIYEACVLGHWKQGTQRSGSWEKEMREVNPVIISVLSMVVCPAVDQKGGAYTNYGSPVDLRRKWLGLQLMECPSTVIKKRELLKGDSKILSWVFTVGFWVKTRLYM